VASLPDPVLACSLKEQKNLNSFFAVMFGVSNTAVSRLAKTWEVTAFGLRPAPRGPLRSAEMELGPLGWPRVARGLGSRQTLHLSALSEGAVHFPWGRGAGSALGSG